MTNEEIVESAIRMLREMGCTCGGLNVIAFPVDRYGEIVDSGHFFTAHENGCPLTESEVAHEASDEDKEMLEKMIERQMRRLHAPLN